MTALANDAVIVSGPPESGRRLRSRRWVVTAAALLVAIAGWIFIGNHPAVSDGSFGTYGPDFRAATGGITETRYVLRGNEGTFVTSIRNDGRIPFTVLGLDVASAGPFVQGVEFQPDPFAAGKGIGDLSLPTQRRVTLRGGEQAGVVLRFEVDRCVFMEAGSYFDHDALALRVRQAGITTTQSLPLPLPLTVEGKSTPQNYPPDCPPIE